MRKKEARTEDSTVSKERPRRKPGLKHRFSEMEAISEDISQMQHVLDRKDFIRYLVDLFYQLQDFRKATKNQVRAAQSANEQNQAAQVIFDTFDTMESFIYRLLDTYIEDIPPSQLIRDNVFGVGPVILSGLYADIDITRAPMVGHIWSFAGITNDPAKKWIKGKKRPFNARLKTLCYKISDCFVKFSNDPRCVFGHLYQKRKKFEIERDLNGYNKEGAKAKLDAGLQFEKANMDRLKQGLLPLFILDLRARRYAVKLFLSLWHHIHYRHHYHTDPPMPYAIDKLHHEHYMKVEDLLYYPASALDVLKRSD